MSDDIVKLKGTKSGLKLVFAQGIKFEEIEQDILNKLESGSGFFMRGTEIFVPGGTFPEEQMERLRKIFHQYGLMFRTEERTAQPVSQEIPEVPAKPSGEDDDQQMLVVRRTLRGGQEINTKSSVLVCGNVNPGAQIIAGGSIDIRGTCRGMVHAGYYGDTAAVVIADRLMPTQIRIADKIARSPDNLEETDKAERASIKDGIIVIEPIER